MNELGAHRPRNVGWARIGALLYGDWGTSKAYVLGFAFMAAGFSSLPIILAVCALTGLVGYNYIIICRHFPDGGGVYSAAREQSRVLAVLGSLLLLANFIVTASLSAWDAVAYFGIPREYIKFATIGSIVIIGAINYFGPKHSGSFALALAIPMVVAVIAIIGLSVPSLTLANFEPPHTTFKQNWIAFVGVILALSGAESIANLTGVMELDPGATHDKPSVGQTAKKAIWPVALEVVFGTALLGWAMLSLPHSMTDEIKQRYEDVVRFLGEHYGTERFGPHFGHLFGVYVGLVVGLLLLSAVNTAIGAMIGLIYMLARDREMPQTFTKLNAHGVPWQPLLAAIIFPSILVILSDDLDSLADMYAIGVVGAITVNLGSSCFNKKLKLNWREFTIMFITFVILFAVEVTIAKTKSAALFFAVSVLGTGFGLRWYSMKRAGIETVMMPKEMAAATSPELWANLKINLSSGQAVMVAARGITPVLRFALEEARLRSGTLYVLYVKELAVTIGTPNPSGQPERPRWQDDRRAAEIMYGMLEMGRENNVPVVPLYFVSDNPTATILDLSATLGIDFLILGAPHRSALVHLLKGNVVNEVAKNLPENIQLVIHG